MNYKIVNGKKYIHYSNIETKILEHVKKALEFAYVNDYIFDNDLYDVAGNEFHDENYIGLYFHESECDKQDAYLQAYITLKNVIRTKFIEAGYDMKDIPMSEIYYGMNTKNLKKV